MCWILHEFHLIVCMAIKLCILCSCPEAGHAWCPPFNSLMATTAAQPPHPQPFPCPAPPCIHPPHPTLLFPHWAPPSCPCPGPQGVIHLTDKQGVCRPPLRQAGDEAGDDPFVLPYRRGLAVVAGEAGALLLRLGVFACSLWMFGRGFVPGWAWAGQLVTRSRQSLGKACAPSMHPHPWRCRGRRRRRRLEQPAGPAFDYGSRQRAPGGSLPPHAARVGAPVCRRQPGARPKPQNAAAGRQPPRGAGGSPEGTSRCPCY